MNPTATRLRKIHETQNRLITSPSSHDVIELAMAVATSLPISRLDETALLWLMIAGPPASAKTETVLSLKDVSDVYLLDSLTENSFVSGYLDPKTGAAPDDLLPKLNGKCLIIKDLTTLFSMREDKVKKIVGDLQSIYDGEYVKFTGTRGRTACVSQFSMLGCITSMALSQHHRYMSAIGGRFLLYRIQSLTDEERADGFELSWNMGDRKASVQGLRDLVGEHVTNLQHAPLDVGSEYAEQRRLVNLLAMLLVRGRAVIQKEEIQTEEPWRAFQQLRNLGKALARVHGRPSMTDHELELLRRVVLSSIPVDRAQVLALFAIHPAGLTIKSCAEGIDKSNGRASQLLKELVDIKLVVVDKSKPEYVYHPLPDLAELLIEPIESLDHVKNLSAPGDSTVDVPGSVLDCRMLLEESIIGL